MLAPNQENQHMKMELEISQYALVCMTISPVQLPFLKKRPHFHLFLLMFDIPILALTYDVLY